MTVPPQGRLLMFDLDGTLIDSREDLALAVNLMRTGYGLPPLPTAMVAGFIGDGIHKLVERALKGYPAELKEAVRRTASLYREHMVDRTVLYPGVRQGLARLRQHGYTLALISNKPAVFCRELLDHFQIMSCFSLALGGDDTEHHKPHPEPLLKTMQALESAPEESWMVGDYAIDMQAARQAHCRSAFVTYGIGTPGRETPDAMFDSFPDLVRFFVPG